MQNLFYNCWQLTPGLNLNLSKQRTSFEKGWHGSMKTTALIAGTMEEEGGGLRVFYVVLEKTIVERVPAIDQAQGMKGVKDSGKEFNGDESKPGEDVDSVALGWVLTTYSDTVATFYCRRSFFSLSLLHHVSSPLSLLDFFNI